MRSGQKAAFEGISKIYHLRVYIKAGSGRKITCDGGYYAI